MMTAGEVFAQNDGRVTAAFYHRLNSIGRIGEIATALFRAQKRSCRAKEYRRGRYRRMAYDVKAWSMSEVCRLLGQFGDVLGFAWGWKQDLETVFGDEPSWVLYVDIPDIGQVSFHSPTRSAGPEYLGEWDGAKASAERIIAFADKIMANGDSTLQERADAIRAD